MKKLMVLFLAVMFLFCGAIVLPAPTDRCEDEKAKIAELESDLVSAQAELDKKDSVISGLQSDLVIASEQLAVANEQLMIQDAEIVVLEQQVITANDKVKKQAVENAVLEDKLAQCYAAMRPPSKGFWIGAKTGIPFGVLGTASYQFNDRFMVGSAFGYLGGFQMQAGFSTRIGK